MKKLLLFVFCTLMFVLFANAQTIEKVEEFYYLVSPNAQYYAGSQEGASAYRYSLATKEENRIDPEGDLGFRTNAIANDGTVAGSYGWKAALWGKGDSYEYLPLPKEGLTELEKASNDAVVISADGKQIVVAMNADAPKTYYVYTKKEDGSYDMVKLPMPEKDPIYGMYAQWYGVRDMSLDGNTLIGFFLTDDSMRQLPLIWRRVDGVWSYEFFGLDVCLKKGMTIPPYPYDKIYIDEVGDEVLPYDVWDEWKTAQYEAESGYYYQAKGMSMSGNGRYVALDMGIQLEGEMYGRIYAAAYDLEKDTVVVFQDIQNSTSLSVNDNGEVIVATPKTDSFRWSYVVSINEPSKPQTLTEWVKVRTDGAIDLANYMTYQLEEEFVVVEGTAYWAKEGEGLVTYMWDYFGTGMFESFFVTFNGSFMEDDNEGEDITEEEVYGLYVASENPEMGGVKIILVAEAIEGFEFDGWSDGNIENPRTIILSEDTELYAYFRMAQGENPVDTETSKISVAEVCSRDGMLYVEGAESDYHVLDMAGRLIYSGRESALNLPRGVYLVTIAGEVEKVVI